MNNNKELSKEIDNAIKISRMMTKSNMFMIKTIDKLCEIHSTIQNNPSNNNAVI